MAHRPAPPLSALLPLLAALACAGALAACSPGGNAQPAGLSAGLTAEMDRPGAQLDRTAALGIVNQYRATRGVPPLSPDPALDQEAQAIATGYATSGTPPAAPAGRIQRLSAGYANFAETFSGWRNSPADADVMAAASARRAGLAVAYSESSTYGTHWVLLLE